MPAPEFSTEQVLGRLRTLQAKLEAEGMYVSADTVWLAIQEIIRLRAA